MAEQELRCQRCGKAEVQRSFEELAPKHCAPCIAELSDVARAAAAFGGGR